MLIWRHRALFRRFLAREIKSRYLGSISGYFWVLVQPLAQLALYSLVFTTIFKVRFPELEQHSFVEFVAIALWPWVAFHEGVMRATTAITNNAGLIRKIALPYELLVYAAVGGSYIVHGVGFLLVLGVLTMLSAELFLNTLPLVLWLWGLLLLLTLGIALILSALQVFLKDIEHLLAPVFMLLFYASPILYPLSLVPEPFRTLILANPLSYFLDRLRALLMFGEWVPSGADVLALLGSGLLFIVGLRLFRRCAGRFEEFL
ncbi:ABC transporter permease [Nitrosococcus oceani]|uniref:Transport permease protein n=2 Tax=Nitrosococcus oceani TaxID=1229 RepID=Q3J954_NITOC|nr:ABC transporter permease [Nitrosococcus oceani]KFI18942.1 phosphate ABC transporter permease [Nitrosococcus oceani C-27]ABA58642.1 ABC polysaccharide/polyol phosphate export systems, inner membrane subunit [Nitrosococcus oceani ATCC 19707]EDZ68114.1 ABC-2 type transporter superfamily [Nitrosococcus oceani AFC27]KFI22224.1 phosphate ABC transporter permease [Nitrosococcus oceani]GEM19762.1 phosphate ABC transporter permease [Nitrosococcus oceani]